MKKKLLTVLMVSVLVVGLTGCGKSKGSTGQTEKVSAIDNNANYFVKIKGTKFNAGDKISNLSKVGLSQEERVLDEKIASNQYMIGAGRIYDSNNKNVFNLTPFNSSNSQITVKDAVIGGIDVGGPQYDRISSEVLALQVEVAGGIKLGSSYDDVVKVFGETDQVYTAESLGYTKYTYKSSETYRKYEFTVDKDNKVSEIYWQNLVFNK